MKMLRKISQNTIRKEVRINVAPDSCRTTEQNKKLMFMRFEDVWI